MTFRKLKQDTYAALESGISQNQIVAHYIDLAREKQFDPAWTKAFLTSMEADLSPRPCQTYEDTLQYIYGSAEVIGLMMARVMDLPKEAHAAAQKLGRAYQLINFIRDVSEDNALGRQYIPTEHLKKFDLKSLRYEDAMKQPDEFKALIAYELELFAQELAAAEIVFHYIPKRMRVAIKTATAMYRYTAQRILEDPFIVFREKVRPSRLRILANASLYFVMG